MSNFYSFFRKNRQPILSIAAFSLAVSLIMIFLPKDRKFKYEYQQNKVWLHEDLYAPFSFAIDKNAAEIKRERDSILHEFSPVYDVDTSVFTAVLDSMVHSLSAHFKETFQGKKPAAFFQSHNLEQFYQTALKLYKTGVYDSNKKQYKTMVVENGSHRSRVAFSRMYSLHDAANKLLATVPEKLVSDSDIKNIVYNTLRPNVLYNEARSEILKEQLLSRISGKYDFINEGSSIINHGDVITEYTMNVLNSLKKEYEAQRVSLGNTFLILVGQLILIIAAFVVLFFLLSFTIKVMRNFKQSFFIITIVMLFVAMAALVSKFEHISINLIPFVALPIVIKLFINRRVAVYTHIITILIIGFLAPNSYYFVFLQTCVGMIALFAIGSHYERRSLFFTAAISMASYSVIYTGFSLMENGSLVNFKWGDLGWFAMSCTLLLTTYLFVWIFEKIFGLTSDLTYFELTDTNHGVLRELNQKAPGTFQHSLQVENLTEAALQRIDGNVLLGRAAALYHDIGKLKNPHYFIENQSHSENPHNRLEPEESARILINHVIDGLEIAKKHNLPQLICNMIYSHHGNSQALFFVKKQKDLYPNEPVDLSKFTYPKFYMKNKELAVLMIADVVEATVRSLKEFSKEKIDETVSYIVDEMIETKRLKNFDITLRELEKVRSVFVEKLVNVYHSRIAYPQQTQQD